jgi:hypothetical protein
MVFRIPESLGDYQFSDLATLEITPHGFPAQQPIFEVLGPTITPADFTRLMQDVRRQTLNELGPRAHLPD